MNTERRLIIATPIDGEFPTAKVTVGWAQQVYQCGVKTIVTYYDDVVRARNRLVAEAYANAPDFTHILWWDADTYVTDPTLVTRMLDTGHDVIGTNYPRKRKDGARVGVPIPENQVAGRDGCFEMLAVGFGLTITSRRALDEIGAVARPYTAHLADGGTLRCRDFFGLVFINAGGGIVSSDDADDESHELVSEDYSLCARWRELGGRVMMMPSNGVEHIGDFAYDGTVLPSK